MKLPPATHVRVLESRLSKIRREAFSSRLRPRPRRLIFFKAFFPQQVRQNDQPRSSGERRTTDNQRPTPQKSFQSASNSLAFERNGLIGHVPKTCSGTKLTIVFQERVCRMRIRSHHGLAKSIPGIALEGMPGGQSVPCNFPDFSDAFQDNGFHSIRFKPRRHATIITGAKENTSLTICLLNPVLLALLFVMHSKLLNFGKSSFMMKFSRISIVQSVSCEAQCGFYFQSLCMELIALMIIGKS